MTVTKESTAEHIVDLEKDPYISSVLLNNAKVDEHRGEGVVRIKKMNDGLYIDDRKIILYLSKKQIDGDCISGRELREKMSDKPVVNANVLDFLLKHPELIPDDWKARCIFFWGTIYRDTLGWNVRCLVWESAGAGPHKWYSRLSGSLDWHNFLRPSAVLKEKY